MKTTNLFKLSFLGLFLGSCGFLMVATTDIKSPKVKYVGHKIEKVTSDEVQVNLDLSAHNSNDIGLKNVFVSYELFAEGNRLFKGSDIPLKLDPNKETIIKIPVKVNYKGIFATIRPVIERLMKENKSLPIEVRALVYGKPTVYNNMAEGDLFSFSHKEKKIIQIPLPKVKTKAQKKVDQLKNKAKDALKKLF